MTVATDDRLGAALPSWVPPSRPLLVISPHPDDETLLFGGLIARHADLGLAVTVIAATDGESGHPRRDGGDLASMRRAEQDRAVHVLTRGGGTVRRLGLPDGRLDSHIGAVADAVDDELQVPTIIAAPSPLDHHADHVACAAAVRRVGHPHVVLRGFFWAWHHTPAAWFPRDRMVRLGLDEGQRARRARALALHASQVTDEHADRLLGPVELAPARRPFEVVEVRR